MDSEKLLKRKIEQLLIIPTAASLLLVGMCVVLFLVDDKSAIIASMVVGTFIILEVIILIWAKTALSPLLFNFSMQHSQVQKQLLDEFAVPYAIVDTDGKILWGNDPFVEIFGEGIKKRVKRKINAFFPEVTEELLNTSEDVSIDLSYDEATYMNANEGLGSSVDNAQVNEPWGLVEGVNSLTPEQALCYARMRYVGNSDWDRVNRQKKIIQAAFAKMKSNPFSILKVLNQAAPSITTDMTDPYLTRACLYALLCGSDMNAATLPGDGMFTADSIDGQSVLVPDLNACHEALINYLYGSSANGDLFKAKASSTPSSTTGTTESDSGADSSEDTWTQTENAIPDDSLPFQDDPDGTTGTYDSSPSEPDGTANTDGNNNADGTYNDGGADNGYTGGAGYDTGSDGTDNYDAGQAPDNGGNDASGNTAGTDNTGYAPSDTYNSGDDAAGADNAGADNSAYAQNAADDGQAGY